MFRKRSEHGRRKWEDNSTALVPFGPLDPVGDGKPGNVPGEAVFEGFSVCKMEPHGFRNLTPGSTQLDGSIGCLVRAENV